MIYYRSVFFPSWIKAPSIFCFILCITQGLYGQQKWVVVPPAGKLPASIDKNGISVIPNGRFITPLGKRITVAPHPYGLILSPDGNTAVTANSGTSPLSITIIRSIKSKQPEVQQVPPGVNTEKGVLASVFMGLAISKDNSKLPAAGFTS